ncbi:MAG: YncE family protein [Betaproteobacteria bacterium]|nr:YncE family protein [Betaproteobacteria bacterium]MDE2422718.1 YncE family protein [Betaproteobacteria bacterium]
MRKLFFILLLSFCAPLTYAEVTVVLNSGDGTISLVDRHTYQPIKHFYVGKEPHHLMSLPDNSALIVADAVSNDLVFLNPTTGEIEKRIARISDPYQIGFSPDKKWFVANSLRLDRVDIYRATDFSLVARIPLSSMPSHLAFNQDSSMVFITLQGSHQLAAIDLKTQKVAWIIPVGNTPAGIIMTPDNQHLLIGVMGDNGINVVDWRQARIIKHIATGVGAHNFMPLGDQHHILISNRGADTISLIDTQTLSLTHTFPVPGGPDDMEVSEDSKELWVTCRWLREVRVINLTNDQVTHVIPVGRSPHGLFFISHAGRQ